MGPAGRAFATLCLAGTGQAICGHPRAAAGGPGETAPTCSLLPPLPSATPRARYQTMALPYHLFVISTQVPGMPSEVQYGTALVLLGLVLSLNIVATITRRYFRRRRQW